MKINDDVLLEILAKQSQLIYDNYILDLKHKEYLLLKSKNNDVLEKEKLDTPVSCQLCFDFDSKVLKNER